MQIGDSMRKKQKRGAIAVLVTVLTLALLILITRFVRQLLNLTNDTAVSLLISAAEAVGVLISLVLALHQLGDSKEIARATFLLELNKAYVENPEYVQLYDALQNCLDGRCTRVGACDSEKHCALDFSKSMVSNYLTFFETIYLLISDNVITFEEVDNLFAYRFFLAVHSRFNQQMKLQAQPDNFVNIYRLEHKWLEYRRKIGKETGAGTVYGQHLLQTLVTPEKYAALINGKGGHHA